MELRRFALLPEAEAFHYAVFRCQQFSWLAAFDREDIPASALGHPAFSRFDEGFVWVHAPPVAPTIGPARFVVDIVEGGVPKTQAGHDLGDELSGHGVPLQREVLGICMTNFYCGCKYFSCYRAVGCFAFA
jgi:hypothetical protein